MTRSQWFRAPTAESAKPRRRNRHPEDDLQAEMIAYVDACECLCGLGEPHVLGRHVFAVPNGGRRNPREMVRLKMAGLRPGVSDLVVMYTARSAALNAWTCFSAAMVEVKAQDGKVRASQSDFAVFVASLGGSYHVARSVDALAMILVGLGLQWNESRIAALRRRCQP